MHVGVRRVRLLTGGARSFERFILKDSVFRISAGDPVKVFDAMRAARSAVERYIGVHPAFRTALEPIALASGAPPIVAEMHAASLATGVGPMAAVAGAIAEYGVITSVESEVIVENGGDIFLRCVSDVIVAIEGRSIHEIAFRITPESSPIAVCSSSSRMGHSLSFGDCDLAVVVSGNGALADAAATMVCNAVSNEADIEGAVSRAARIPGIRGALVIRDGKIGMAGRLPEIVKHTDPDLRSKVTRYPPGVTDRGDDPLRA